ncbi:MAG: hypothetical protein EO766_11600 [Hydrotalea sp. AMD]|uniref:hypothetical protein n=1 Tax=Hydrotalea sp. AMD TaxID=2501297 RepID=UPI001025BB1F|nr:hypothetical protein [Hydrotalea sp. AMD]RWZ87177.1 MAG: hypothetical protein EO766_11600 [Hydrotalea sp. AMD]
MIFVAKDKQTGLYSNAIHDWFLDNQIWIKETNHSVEEVIDELSQSNESSCLWTDNVRDADIWNQYNIDRWKKYLPNVEFVTVTITVEK